jgi:hypothetical protein
MKLIESSVPRRCDPADEADETEYYCPINTFQLSQTSTTPFLVAYLADQGDRFDHLLQRNLAGAGLTEADLHHHGIANLSAVLTQKGANVRPYEMHLRSSLKGISKRASY